MTLEGGGALLVVGAAGVALAQPVPVSREMAEQIGTLERAERAKLIEAAHGGPVALPTPSPFLSEQYVRNLPTQAQLDSHPELAPNAKPGFAPGLPGSDTALEANRIYPNTNSHALADGARALGDTARCFPKFESFTGNSRQAFEHLKDVMQPSDGWETHHLVEQNQTPRFGTQAIQNTSNAINLPESLHREVSREYSSKPRFGSEAYDYKLEHPDLKITTNRDYVKTLPFEEQRQFSVDTVREALKNPNIKLNDHERKAVEHELDRLENPSLERDLCPPISQAPNREAPQVAEVQSAVSKMRDKGVNPPDARNVMPWNGAPQYGSFVDLGDGIVAQHIGRGDYSVMDVQQDLGGVQPPIGQYVALNQNGQAQIPQVTSPSIGLG